MKRFMWILLLFIPFYTGYSVTIMFPEFWFYTEANLGGEIKTSYKIDMLIDTGLKFGVKIGFGMKNYHISTINSNLLLLDSIRLYTTPFDLFTLGLFIGKNQTLGYTQIGYQGFQFHNQTNMEYIGYKEIRGSGVEIYRSFWDEMFEPHILVYSAPSIVSPGTNQLNFDAIIRLKMDQYRFEVYAGMGLVNTEMTKHFGALFETLFNKLDFMISLYSPDSRFTDIIFFDSLYISMTEHLISGIFEQSLSLFSRPSYYNDYKENTTGDLDVYLALGLRIEDFGFGVENSLLFSDNYAFTDRPGAYVYFILNSLKYKLGFQYAMKLNPTDTRPSPYINDASIFLMINGQL
ncbi:MAG: hypothetical protein HPY53_07545 [Brevinematales bacterium]|nr:hypothetical protein [Brevinematales bacterium]